MLKGENTNVWQCFFENVRFGAGCDWNIDWKSGLADMRIIKEVIDIEGITILFYCRSFTAENTIILTSLSLILFRFDFDNDRV